DEFDAHVQFARGLVDLADEEEVFDESEDAHGVVAAHDRLQYRLHGMAGDELGRLAKGTKASTAKALPTVATGRLHQVSIDFTVALLAIAMVHGTVEDARTLVALFAILTRLTTMGVLALALALPLSPAF